MRDFSSPTEQFNFLAQLMRLCQQRGWRQLAPSNMSDEMLKAIAGSLTQALESDQQGIEDAALLAPLFAVIRIAQQKSKGKGDLDSMDQEGVISGLAIYNQSVRDEIERRFLGRSEKESAEELSMKLRQICGFF